MALPWRAANCIAPTPSTHTQQLHWAYQETIGHKEMPANNTISLQMGDGCFIPGSNQVRATLSIPYHMTFDPDSAIVEQPASLS